MTTGRQVGAPPPLWANTSSPRVVIDIAMRNQVRILRRPAILYCTRVGNSTPDLSVEVLAEVVLGHPYHCQGRQCILVWIMACSWCNGSISILRALTDSHYCCNEHRDYAKMNALHSEEVQRNDPRRRHRRYAVDGGVLEVSWLDVNGRMQSTRSRVLNISEDGIALQLPD